MSSANVLDQQSITRKHRRILWASGLGIFLDGYDLSIMAVALILLKQQWHLTPSELGALGTAALVGALVGGLFGGPIACQSASKFEQVSASNFEQFQRGRERRCL